MKVEIYDSAQEIACVAADIFENAIKSKPDCVLGLATGATPVPTYNELIKRYNEGRISFKKVSTFNLDEYCDLPKENENSYWYFMHDKLFNHVDIDESNVNFLNGNADDVAAESKRYSDAMAAAGGIDIQLLGIGTNGHIGFNEPADEFTGESFKVKLAQSTIDSNQKYFADVPMPRFALTMGIGSIMRAKKIILIATGRSKAKAVYGMIKGEVTPHLPASVLNNHPDALILLDKAAASEL